MEVNLNLIFLKEFDFATVKHNDIEYLNLSSYSEDLLSLSQLDINDFEAIYERELLHLKSIFVNCLNSFTKFYNAIIIEFNNSTISFEELKKRLFIEMTFVIDQNQLRYNFTTKNIGIQTLYLFNDFSDELFKRIEEIDDVFSIIKPYQERPDNKLLDTDISLGKIEHLENLSWFDWNNIYRLEVNPNDLIEGNIIELDIPAILSKKQTKLSIESMTTFDEAIRPEAKKEFEKWYDSFCIDEPSTLEIDIILFFKLMNNKNYFIEKFEILQLHQITLDRTRRKISLNYFKSNGSKLFENWLYGKPEIPIYRDVL